MTRPWSKSRRSRHLALARLLDRWAARIRADVKVHTPKRSMKPKLVQERAA